jgi:4-hydroxy 2-oxovalerate aldolase
MNVKLLDCTLRDGGYINDWNFGHNTLVNVFERLVSAKIDVIEIGLLDQRREFDINRSIFPNTQCIQKIYGKLDKKQSETVAMIDYGTCDLSNIQPRSETIIDGIRVIFKKNKKENALQFCSELKKLGYKVYAQLVSTTDYSEKDLDEVIELCNQVEPFAVAIVDTYGLMYKDNVIHYYKILEAKLKPGISLGYHSHNNFQLGFANAVELIRAHKDSQRNMLIDGTVYGMGKGAGNGPLELLAMHLNDLYAKKYDIGHLLEIIDVNIINIHRATPWGYSLGFFVAASNSCHPSYVSFLLDKKTLSVSAINDILRNISPDKKLSYDSQHIEELYLSYQSINHNDTDAYNKLVNILSGNPVLILGPGSTIETEKDKIHNFVSTKQPVVFSINFIPNEFKASYMFLTNSKRYLQQASNMLDAAEKSISVVATSNLAKSGGKFDYVLDYSKLADSDWEFPDNSLLMLLKVMSNVGVKKIALAGFDGYSVNGTNNYFNSALEYNHTANKYKAINSDIQQFLEQYKKNAEITFVTSSLYDTKAG